VRAPEMAELSAKVNDAEKDLAEKEREIGDLLG
jgi:hypothetical protein